MAGGGYLSGACCQQRQPRNSPPPNDDKSGAPGPWNSSTKAKNQAVVFSSDTHWRANDFYRALGMASDEFCHAAQQETLDACLPMRTNDDHIGMPLGGIIDDRLSNVTYLDGSLHLESCAAQLLAYALD